MPSFAAFVEKPWKWELYLYLETYILTLVGSYDAARGPGRVEAQSAKR